MASKAGAIRAGRAFVELFTENSAYIRGLKHAKKELEGFASFVNGMGRKLVAAGASVLGAFGGAVAMFANMGDNLFDMSARTGLAVEALGRLGFAAGQSGATIEDVEAGVRVMQRSILDLSRDTISAVDNFGSLGLTFSDLQALNPEEQFKLIAERISRLTDPTMQAALAMKVFGRGGTALLPMMSQGVAGLDAMAAEAERLGIVMSGEQAQAASDFADLWGKLTAQFKMSAAMVGAALVPQLSKLGNWISSVLPRFIQWIKDNGDLIMSIAKIASVVVLAGGALLGLGLLASSAASILGLLAGGLTALGTVLGIILSPIGLVVAALAGLMTWFVRSGEASKWLMSTFGPLAEGAMQAFDAIKNALAAGDWTAAANVLWASLKLVWQTGLNWIYEKWITLKNDVLDVWRELGASIQRIIVDVMAFVARQMSDVGLTITQQIGNLAIESSGVDDRTKAAMQSALGITFDAARGANAEQIEANRLGANEEIDAMNAARAADSIAAYNSELAASQKNLDNAQQGWRDAVDAASGARPGVSGPGVFATDTTFDPNAIMKAMGMDSQNLLSEGTFSAAQASAFGTGAETAQERTARASERTALNTEETARELRNGRAIVR